MYSENGSFHAVSPQLVKFLGSKTLYQIPKVSPVAKALGTLAHPQGCGGGGGESAFGGD